MAHLRLQSATRQNKRVKTVVLFVSTTDTGPLPAATGEPTCVRDPAPGSTLKVGMVFEPRFATYAKRPRASNVSETGLVPADTVEAGVSVPLTASMPKTETLFAIALVTYRNRPCESTVKEAGPSPLVTEGVSGAKAPEV